MMFTGRKRRTLASNEDLEVTRGLLVEEAFRRYADWRQQSSMCEVAYREWATSAGSRDSAIAFAKYMAALDREEQAAWHYETVLCGG